MKINSYRAGLELVRKKLEDAKAQKEGRHMGKLWDFERFADSPALIGDTGVTLTYRDLAALSAEKRKLPSAGRRTVRWSCSSAGTPSGALSGYAALMNWGIPCCPFPRSFHWTCERP